MTDVYTIPPKTYFEITSLGYLLVLYLISLHDANRNKLRSYRLFHYLEINMMIALLVSILTYTFALPEKGTPLFICTILRTLDSVMSVMASRVFAVYLLAYINTDGKLKPISVIGNILFSVYLALMVLNIPLKFVLWYMPDGTYMHGTFFVPIVFTAPVYYLTSGMLILILRLKTLGSRERLALSIASFVTLFGTIIQAATNGVLLLSLPFGSVGVFVLYYSLETADYHQLLTNNEKLRIAEQDAIKANRAKSDFLASMSHEIRTPLNAILGMDELILLETDSEKTAESPFSERIRGYAENIRDAGHVLLSVINDILDLTKIESGKMEIRALPYSLRSLTDDVGTMVQVRAEQKGLSYNQSIDPGIPDHLIGDELRIRQIMINLLNNAVKYTDSGTVKMGISMKQHSSDELSLRIYVRDTGIGIREDDLPYIFGDFKRLDEDRNRRIEGTGLGLSIVKRMLDLMGGEISVKSKYGAGSIFTVVIPQKIDPRPAENDEKNKDSIKDAITFHTPDCRYLVVDDNHLNLLVASRFLDGLMGTVETASSGEEALIKMRESKYDLIFMDHMMPELDGIQTYEKSVKDPDNLNLRTPMIMMTANAISGVREEYINIGFTDYISKPVELSELISVVKRLLPPEKITQNA